MKKIVHIVGPTGVGKTALALSLAGKFNGSLISADSVQVYKGLDIISGKDIPPKSKFYLLQKISGKFDFGFYDFGGIKVYLLDIVSPSYSFSVYDFLKVSKLAINEVLRENKTPIIVGGTGLYVDRLKTGLDTQSLITNPKLRNIINKKTIQELQAILKKLSIEKFQSLNNSDVNNPRRLIRAIEIENSNGLVKPEPNPSDEFEILQIGLSMDKVSLNEKIDKRVKERIKNGALAEAENLFKKYNSLSSPVKNANGYKQLFSFLKKEINWEEAIYRWKISEYRHAKNQMTWFKKYGETKWFDAGKNSFKRSIDQEISTFLT